MSDPKKLTGMSQKTQTAFLSLHVITACCHAILNTQFTAPDPKPKWFDALNSKLDDAKKVASTWIDTLGPEVASNVPATVIDYSTTYDALTQQIHDIAKAHPDARGADNQYVQQIDELVGGMLGNVGSIITQTDKAAADLEQWGKDLQAAHDALTSGAADIQKAEVDLQTDITKMNGAIKRLNATIAEENKAIAISAIAVGVGIFMTIAGIALAPLTGGYSLVVSGVGVLSIIGGSVTWGIMQAKINKQYDEIAKDTKELKDDQKQLVALQGLAQASDQATTSMATASQALSDFRTSWGVFEDELKGVRTKLNAAEVSISVIVQDAFTSAAAEEWADAEQFAKDLSEAKMEISKKTLTPGDDPKVHEAAA